MKRIKVCCFCERWESGGIESFLCNVLTHMDTQSIQVDIVTAELVESVFTEALRRHGVRFVALSGKQQRLWRNHQLFRRLLEAEAYQVVHLHIFHGLSLYYAWLSKQAGVPLRIAHSHNTALRRSRTRPLKMLVHRAAKVLYTSSATDLWACSRAAAEFLFSKGQLAERGFQFIPNGIDIDRFRFDGTARERARKALGLHGKLVIGSVGRLCYQKNQAFLLDAFAEVICRKPESCLLLVGEGEAERDLRQRAELLGISSGVIFYGTSAHVAELLCAMDVFAFPSRFEGLGIAAVEAQAAGLPVLCSEHVPSEARVTPQLHMLPLSAGARLWAEKLLELGAAQIDRMEGSGAVRSAGFDIADVSAEISASYMGSQSNEYT